MGKTIFIYGNNVQFRLYTCSSANEGFDVAIFYSSVDLTKFLTVGRE